VLPDQGPVWEMAPGRSAAFKMQRGETGENVMMFEEATPAGTVTPYHLHHDSDEITYVLSGEMTFKIGDEVTVGGPGTCAFMPRGIAHAWKNTGLETGRALFVFTPGAAGKIFEDLNRERRPLSSMDDREIAEIFARYGWEVVGPPPFSATKRADGRRTYGMDETKLENLARLSGRASSKALDALGKHGFDLRGKLSAPISRVPRRAPPEKTKSGE
jgi:quercetin dioxygenase-like cupin family protein